MSQVIMLAVVMVVLRAAHISMATDKTDAQHDTLVTVRQARKCAYVGPAANRRKICLTSWLYNVKYDTGRKCFACRERINYNNPSCCGFCHVCRQSSRISQSRRNYCAWVTRTRKCTPLNKVQGIGPGCVRSAALCIDSGGIFKAACGECALVCALPPTGPAALAIAGVCAVALVS